MRHVLAFSVASSFIRARIAKRTTVHADEAGSWDGLQWPNLN